MPRKRVISRELGESFVSVLAAANPSEVRTAVREWATKHKDELHELVLDGLNYQSDLWEERIEEKGLGVAESMFKNMQAKIDNKLYDMVLQITATYARDDSGNSIQRYRVEDTGPYSKSIEGDEDWGYDDGDDGGRSSNDDRSDSMNPNSDAYQASTDNRSDQMNPNNDAYHSSRR